MSTEEAWTFAVMAGLGGVLILSHFNWLAAGLAAFSLFLYAFIYTPLKKVSSVSVLVGAVPGSLPCLIGWAAGNDELSAGGWILFALQFFWQFPHFWAIAWIAHKDYYGGGLQVDAVYGGADKIFRHPGDHLFAAVAAGWGTALADGDVRTDRGDHRTLGQPFDGWSVCAVVPGDDGKGSQEGDVQQLYLFARSFACAAGDQKFKLMEAVNEQRKKIHPHKFTLWVALASIVMMFAGLTSAYVVKRDAAGWTTFAIPKAFWYSTATILLSSLTMQIALRSFKEREMLRYRNLLTATAILGIVFMLFQWTGFREIWHTGITLHGSGGGQFLYVIAGLHAGACAGWGGRAVAMLARAFVSKVRSYNAVPVELMATYWHFVDLLWVYLLIFFI